MFIPPITDATREMLKSNMNEKWRQWKGDLKYFGFDRSKTIEEIVADVEDGRVDEAQYRKLVEHWFSDEAQVSHTFYKEYIKMFIIMTNILY